MFNLQQHELAGIIAQLVAIPFIILSAKKWWLASQSLSWPKVIGIVIKGLDFSMTGHLIFLYEYQIDEITYQGKKPFFANTYKQLKGKKSWNLIEKYTEGKIIDVFYKPSNPKLSTLEAGRKDGVMAALAVSALLFIIGFVIQHFPIFFWNLFS